MPLLWPHSCPTANFEGDFDDVDVADATTKRSGYGEELLMTRAKRSGYGEELLMTRAMKNSNPNKPCSDTM